MTPLGGHEGQRVVGHMHTCLPLSQVVVGDEGIISCLVLYWRSNGTQGAIDDRGGEWMAQTPGLMTRIPCLGGRAPMDLPLYSPKGPMTTRPRMVTS